MTERTKVAKAWSRLHRWRTDGLYRRLFKMIRPVLRRNLLSQRPILLFFSLYKLGIYCELMGSSMRNTVPSPGADRNT